jgi:hypothetical protein
MEKVPLSIASKNSNSKGELTMNHDSSNVEMQHQLAQERSETFLSRLVRGITGPMVISAGPAPGAREGRPGHRVMSDDPVLLAKTDHVRSKNEPMNSFYARVGLGPVQIRTMSRSEISHFVEVATANEEPKPPTGTFGQPAPQKFVVEA